MHKQRQLNIELLRIISMLLITLWHVGIHFLNPLDHSLCKTIMDYVILFIPFHVDLFILITGYFGIKNCKISLIKNLFLIYFYSISLGFITGLVSGHYIWVETFMPISSNTWWFMTMYFLMLLISPIIENYVKHCSHINNCLIIVIAFFINIYLGHLHHVDGIYDKGMGLVNFVSMYLFGVWIRNEGIVMINKLHWKKSSITIGILIIMAIQYKAQAYVSWVGMTEYCGPYCIVMSVLVFLLFVNINIPEYFRKSILFFSSSAIAVYLITDHCEIREFLKPIFSTYYLPYQNSCIGIVVIILSVIMTFVISCIIDKIRIPITNYAKDKVISFFNDNKRFHFSSM